MTKDVALAVLEKIESYDRIIITRHLRPDGDAVGSTKGLQAILKASFPEKEVLCINEDYADQTAFLGPEDAQLPEEEYRNALVIVLDSAEKGRVSNKNIGAAKELICFDHHVEEAPYGDISVVEPELSSACELVVNWYRLLEDRLVLTKEAATYLYAGMVTDSGRFRFDSTTGDTLRDAALLLDQGVETEPLYANLYMEDFDILKYQAYAYGQMKRTENGVAYLFVDKAMKEQFHLTPEQASNSVNLMDTIKGSLIWLAFIQYDKFIRVRLRSRFVPIRELAAEYNGGGHDMAAGATIYSEDDMREMIRKADKILKEYKETHTGWL